MTAGTNWRDDAACPDADTDLFFPIGTTGPALDQIDQAKRICLACRCGSDAWRGRWSWAQPLASGEARPRTSGAPCAERPPAIAIAAARCRS